MNRVNARRKWVRRAFTNYNLNKSRLSQLKSDYANCEIPTTGSGGGGGGTHGNENGVEKSVLHYLAQREKLERAVKSCERQIALVDKTLHHFTIEEWAKGKRHKQYIENRFLRSMSYRRAAVECEISESTAGYWLEEIYTVSETIAEMEGYLQWA